MKQAIRILKQGGVIAFPTETSYGLACDPRQAKALSKIFRLKGRERGKPLPLIASSIAQVKKIARLDGQALRLAKRHWPGPLTLVLPAKVRLPAVVAPNRQLAIRVSSNAIARRLARGLGYPMTATSANRSGKPPAQSAAEVRRALGEGLLVVDGGRLPKRRPSTIVQVEKDGSWRVLRQGAIRL